MQSKPLESDDLFNNKLLHKSIFISDSDGSLKKYSYQNFELLHDYGKIHKGQISHIGITPDQEWLITTDNLGHQKIRSLTDSKLKQTYLGKVHKSAICSMVISNNNQTFITGDRNGCQITWSISQQKAVNNFGKEAFDFVINDYDDISEAEIVNMYLANDNKVLYVFHLNGKIAKWRLGGESQEISEFIGVEGIKTYYKQMYLGDSIIDGQENLIIEKVPNILQSDRRHNILCRQTIKDGDVIDEIKFNMPKELTVIREFKNDIICSDSRPNHDEFVTINILGQMHLWSMKKCKAQYNFGKIYSEHARAVLLKITPDSRHIITSGMLGNLMIWSLKKRILLKSISVGDKNKRIGILEIRFFRDKVCSDIKEYHQQELDKQKKDAGKLSRFKKHLIDKRIDD